MKALVFDRYGGSDRIGFADIPRPVPGPDDLLVQVHAAGLNPIDNVIPKGAFKSILKFQLPATLGSDVAGVVREVGSRVTRFKPGDAIFASTFDLGSGTLAEFARVPQSAAASMPANLDFVQAASIPMVGLTSWQALAERARVKPGDKVFVPAGSGGIGTFAIQLAKHLGAKVATMTSAANLELVRSLGADETIDYGTRAFDEVLRDYDVALGTLRGDAVGKSLRILAKGGQVISLVGPPDAHFARARGMGFFMVLLFGMMSRKLNRSARSRGARYSFLFVRPDGRQLSQIGDLLRAGIIRPVIDRCFPFERAKDALAYLETGRAKGKVVVQMI
jgi:NADPH:quinone reductase-like Zn-dependent oxidoreductase